MNIFAVDENPYTAAMMLCDKHVCKMVIESVQILSTVINLRGGQGPYKSTHVHHPCVAWAGQTYGNYVWLLNHFNALCLEFRIRYGNMHACERYHDELSTKGNEIFASQPISLIKRSSPGLSSGYNGTLSHEPFVQCMPEIYKQPDDPVSAYRLYYYCEKLGFARWRKGRPAPAWLHGFEG